MLKAVYTKQLLNNFSTAKFCGVSPFHSLRKLAQKSSTISSVKEANPETYIVNSLSNPTVPRPRRELIDPLILPRFADPKNVWWKSPVVHAWIHNFENATAMGIIELSKNVFGLPLREDILFRALRYEESWRAQGTESTKSLGQVRGSTRKVFPQKGRGKARVGTRRSPIFKGGYTVHGAKPHDKSIDIPQKLYNLSIKTALSTKFAQDQLLIVDELAVDTVEKLKMINKLKKFDLFGRKVCMLYGNDEPNRLLVRVADQFKTVSGKGKEKQLFVANAREISVSPLLDTEILVLDKAAVEILEEMYTEDRSDDYDELLEFKNND
ncbi:54S ribosomal protein, mitochondrial [Nowakowskiella sp. JEL0078]|nr:54S ribosomal protein, mitochondrial [Nowakowskiella sp. JEL0078]